MVVLSLVMSSALVGVLVWLAARHWPAAVAEPHVSRARLVEEVHHRPRLRSLLDRRLDPRELTGFALTAALGAVILSVTGIGLLLAMIHGHSGLARWDLSAARFGATHASRSSTHLLRDVSQLGGTVGVILIGAAVAGIEYRRLRVPAVVTYLFVVIAGQFLVSNAVKALVGRKRPDLLHLTGYSGSSFPSGHATAAAATLMAAAFLVGRRRSARSKAILAGGAAGLAAAVAASRVLLGVHWLTDVLAGLLLGWGWFALCSIAFGGRLLRFGAPAGEAEVIASVLPDPSTAPRATGRRLH
jgi:undecaprenyl-diphosphatase